MSQNLLSLSDGLSNKSDTTSRYDAPPEAALAAIHAHDGPLLIDLDETLYLRNSTEDFIDCARPALLALLLLRALDMIKPWRLTGRDTRDNWRVCAIAILFPWTQWRWRAQARRLAASNTNQRLKAALDALPRPPIILTTGFRSIVTPLLAEMGFVDAKIVAARLCRFADRRNGKLQMASVALGTDAIGRCLAVTDSLADLDLLDRCARPFRTVWPQARYRRALSGVYLPGQYISQIKHPGKRFILRDVLQEDFAFWVLSSIGLAANPALHIAGLLLLSLSFWTIYERGYADNDVSGSRYEADPVLSAAFGRVEVATPTVQPWIWALAAGGAANMILHPEAGAFIAHFGLWIGVLISTHACFSLYNRIDKMSRVWLYPLLQLARSAAFTVVAPIEPAGAAALGAHVLSRWAPYQFYRLASRRWPNTRMPLMRLISFMLLIVLMACAVGAPALTTWSTLALLLWNAFRARHDISAVFKSARRIDRPAHGA
jgi:hypothetical protein